MLEGSGEKATLLHCWWECKLVQPLWRTVWRLLKKLEIELPYDPGDDQGWDGWMTSLTQWYYWLNRHEFEQALRVGWTGKPGVLQSMGLQRVGHNWATERNWYVPQLPYLFICWWTSRLLPCPSYCKQFCNEHWGTCVSSNSGFFSVYAQQWDCWVILQFYLQFFNESPHCSP